MDGAGKEWEMAVLCGVLLASKGMKLLHELTVLCSLRDVAASGSMGEGDARCLRSHHFCASSSRQRRLLVVSCPGRRGTGSVPVRREQDVTRQHRAWHSHCDDAYAVRGVGRCCRVLRWVELARPFPVCGCGCGCASFFSAAGSLPQGFCVHA